MIGLFSVNNLKVLVCICVAWRGPGLLNGHRREPGWRRETWWWLMMLPSERRVSSSPPWRDRSGSTPTCRNYWWLILHDNLIFKVILPGNHSPNSTMAKILLKGFTNSLGNRLVCQLITQEHSIHIKPSLTICTQYRWSLLALDFLFLVALSLFYSSPALTVKILISQKTAT